MGFIRSYIDDLMNMKLLSVLTLLYIYHGCSTWKTLWEENFTLSEFTAVNMKMCGCCNIRKHIEIKVSERYITLDISLKLGSLDKMRIISSDPKVNLGRSGKEFIIYLGIKAKSRPK